ncbi:ATP synthase subunit 5 [Verticillium dahliae VdLs.17]|uniref:ATP synthase subunit 5, mitochondrial n=1 Tax=Verticillium dahliae (strain VdLs.17 / ATCC MYA-4575 / FGSC 10137) TaxID=498257 RepID=G2X9G5_VERDV|nr:ATP synthase subunit 5 [Verticillium dahliae VdLs.17]EGY15633.1 ATP synthase subunit 5 [Verticillium dahliae VdLs.17]
MLSRQVLRAFRASAPVARPLAARRTYAAAASSSEIVTPPISVFGIDGTYATALVRLPALLLLSETRCGPGCSDQLGPRSRAAATCAASASYPPPRRRRKRVEPAILKKDEKLVAILDAPTLSADDKSAIVAELKKQAGGANDTVSNFLAALAENNRLGILPGVCEKFAELIAAAKGEVELIVTSAQVNPEIVGGLIVEVGDRTIDLSVSSKIAKMNKLLTDNL